GWPDSAKFPVNFPVSREFGAETSSQLTASSATQCGLPHSTLLRHGGAPNSCNPISSSRSPAPGQGDVSAIKEGLDRVDGRTPPGVPDGDVVASNLHV